MQVVAGAAGYKLSSFRPKGSYILRNSERVVALVLKETKTLHVPKWDTIDCGTILKTINHIYRFYPAHTVQEPVYCDEVGGKISRKASERSHCKLMTCSAGERASRHGL